MPFLATLTVIGVVALAFLIWFFLRTRSQDMIDATIQKRKTAGKIATRANYVDALHSMPVALSLAEDTIYYENADLEASLDLSRIDEVEYDDYLATGHEIEHGNRALRLRSHGTTFEFVLTPNDSQAWMSVLPPRHMDSDTAHAM